MTICTTINNYNKQTNKQTNNYYLPTRVDPICLLGVVKGTTPLLLTVPSSSVILYNNNNNNNNMLH